MMTVISPKKQKRAKVWKHVLVCLGLAALVVAALAWAGGTYHY